MGFPTGGKHNNKTPVEVTSDSLDVLQQDNKAVFSGHVVAIQGDVRLTSDKMTVYYAAADKLAKKNDKNGTGAIKKIDAEGSVFLATAEETASGSIATYDVEHQEIHLTKNVVLTRGKNTLKGDKLTYYFASGRSVFSGVNAKNGGNKERVRALFVPENEKSDKQ